MDKRCVLGIFAREGGLRGIVNDLSEMGFDETDISVITSGGFSYTTNLGPLKHADENNLHEKLIHVGLATDLARSIKSYIKDGGAIVAVGCRDDQIEGVVELLDAYGAMDIQVSE